MLAGIYYFSPFPYNEVTLKRTNPLRYSKGLGHK